MWVPHPDQHQKLYCCVKIDTGRSERRSWGKWCRNILVKCLVCLSEFGIDLYHSVGIFRRRQIDNSFSYLSQKIGFDISSKISPHLHEMLTPPLFLLKNEKTFQNVIYWLFLPRMLIGMNSKFGIMNCTGNTRAIVAVLSNSVVKFVLSLGISFIFLQQRHASILIKKGNDGASCMDINSSQ